MNSLKSIFEIISENDDFVLIRDMYNGNTKTVTNDAENVVSYLYDKGYIHGKLLFYIDTEGNTDELLHENGVFKGFKPGPEWLSKYT